MKILEIFSFKRSNNYDKNVCLKILKKKKKMNFADRSFINTYE